MKRLLVAAGITILLSGCYEKTPTKEEAVEIARQELSMALCGDRSTGCIKSAIGNAHIGERLNDGTNKIVVRFKGIQIQGGSVPPASEIVGGTIAYDFEAKNGKTYIKEISLWSEDSEHSVELCGHNYAFCRK